MSTAYGVAGCTSWYDSSNTPDISFGVGTLVSGIAERSGNGYNMAQATATNQPDRNGTQNSLATINFNGTDNYIDLSSGPFWNDQRWSYVVPDAGNWFFFFIKMTGTSGDRTIIGSKSGHLQIRVSGSGNLNVLRSDNEDCGSSNGTVNLNDMAWHRCAVYVSTTVRKFFIDGTDCGTVTVTTGNTFGSYGVIGSKEGSSEWGAFDFGEVLHFNSDIGATNRALVETGMYNKWYAAPGAILQSNGFRIQVDSTHYLSL